MTEAVRKYLTHSDVRFVIAILVAAFGAFMVYSDLREDIKALQVRGEIYARQSEKQLAATEKLTEAVQGLTVTSAKLEERLKGIEKIFPAYKK